MYFRAVCYQARAMMVYVWYFEKVQIKREKGKEINKNSQSNLQAEQHILFFSEYAQSGSKRFSF